MTIQPENFPLTITEAVDIVAALKLAERSWLEDKNRAVALGSTELVHKAVINIARLEAIEKKLTDWING